MFTMGYIFLDLEEKILEERLSSSIFEKRIWEDRRWEEDENIDKKSCRLYLFL